MSIRIKVVVGGWNYYATMILAALFLLCCAVARAADTASWYGEEHRGRLMANGRRFNPDKLTAASWFYNLGTRVVVTHAGRTVTVEITDRGPAKNLVREGRKIDLSLAAFAHLANPARGLVDVAVKTKERQSAQAAVTESR